MLNLVKGLLVSSLGIGSLGVSLYGAIFSSNSKVIKKEDLEIISSGPVLTCDDKYDKYEFLLEPANSLEMDLGSGITLRVYKTSNTGEKKIVPWGDKATENHAWSDWRMTFTSEKIDDIWTKEVGMKWYSSPFIIHGCKDQNRLHIQLINGSKNQGDNAGEGIEGTTIKFEIKEENCTQDLNTRVCDINFSADSNLRWKEGFQPRVRYFSIPS